MAEEASNEPANFVDDIGRGCFGPFVLLVAAGISISSIVVSVWMFLI